MAPTRSISLKKLSDLLFEDTDAVWDSPADGKDKCLKVGFPFERTLSEDSTVLGQPFSRNVSPGGSDDEAEPAVHGHLEATPAAAKLVKGTFADPGPEVQHGQELIAVRPGGEASFVPEDDLAELEVMRALFDNDEASPLILVGRDGTAFYAPDGENVDWEGLQALRSKSHEETTVSPPPSPSSSAGGRPRFARPLCPGARPLAPPQGGADRFEEEEEAAAADFAARRPDGSVPRSPSLKKLSALLFAGSAVFAAGRRGAALEEPEELVLELPEAAPKAATTGRPQPQGASRSGSSGGCCLQ